MELQLQNYERIRLPRISKWFSVLVAILPILASYASGIPGFSVADICLVLFVGLSMLKRGSRNQYRVSVASLLMGLTLIVLLSLFACLLGFPASTSDVMIRTIRYSFYIIVLFTAGKKFLDVPTLIQCVKMVSFLGSLFIVFQAVMYYVLGIVVKGFLPFLNLYVEQYQNANYGDMYEILNMYRPTSFFLEPAHYARYCIVGIILYLFVDKIIDNKSVFHVMLCVIGIVISTSSQGYFMLAIVASMFLFTRIKYIKSRTIKQLMYLVVIMFPIMVLGILQLPIIQSVLDRSFSGSITDSNSAIGARLSGFASYFDLPLINKLIGTGFGNVPNGVWMSSAAYWLYGSGFFVFAIYLYFLLRSFFRIDVAGKYILFVVGFLFFTDDSFYSYMIVLYFSLVLFLPRRETT